MLMANDHPRPTTADWTTSAACRGTDPEAFHPSVFDEHAIDQAKAICATCPHTGLAGRCVTAILDAGPDTLRHVNAIYGGHTSREILLDRRRQQEQARRARVAS